MDKIWQSGLSDYCLRTVWRLFQHPNLNGSQDKKYVFDVNFSHMYFILDENSYQKNRQICLKLKQNIGTSTCFSWEQIFSGQFYFICFPFRQTNLIFWSEYLSPIRLKSLKYCVGKSHLLFWSIFFKKNSPTCIVSRR